MSTSNRFISVKSVIAKVYRDYNVRSSDFEYDMIEWSAEALDRIGHMPILVDKSRIIQISNNRGIMPPDLEQIDVIYYKLDATTDTEPIEYRDILRYAGGDFNSSLHHKNSYNLTSKSTEFYTINSRFINTSFENGFIYLLYKGFPLDQEGFPIIPDNTKVKEALTHYIIFKMISRGWRHPARLNYLQQKQEWEQACSRARANLLMPDAEDYRRFEQNWVKMVPGLDDEHEEDRNSYSIHRSGDYIYGPVSNEE